MLDGYLNLVFWGNSLFWYLAAVNIFLAVWILLFLLHQIALVKLTSFAEKTNTKIDDLFLQLLQQINWPVFALVSLNLAVFAINIPGSVSRFLAIFTVLVGAYYGLKLTNKLISFWVLNLVDHNQVKSSKRSKSLAHMIELIVQIAAWILVLLWILHILSVDITALVGTLGIGGIAIAFALQSILSDVFASFSIYFDKPFAVGDFIQIGTNLGTVEQIGIKSTRIKTLQGEMLVVPNAELTSLSVQNYSQLKQRRILFKIGLAYHTSNEKLEFVSKKIKEIIENNENCTLERVNFLEFGDFSLNFEIAYYVNSSSYTVYADTIEQVNLKIKQALDENKIEFAFPTQTVLLHKLSE